jgi:hypothetical protein
VSLPAKKAEGRGGGASLLFITTQQVAPKKNNLHRRISALFARRRPFLALQRSRDGHREAQRQSRVVPPRWTSRAKHERAAPLLVRTRRGRVSSHRVRSGSARVGPDPARVAGLA